MCTIAEYLAAKVITQSQPETNLVAQPDYSADISNCAILPVYVTQISQENCMDNLLCSLALH